ncbi:MAG: M28 family peptidase [Bacteroidales bacterium]|nr:M28 family peptidase [Bacteroidales bacterium]MCF8402349.1 M28 family peptidase [Bacteroidales bacterium]
MKKYASILFTILLTLSLLAQETENLENKFLKNTRQLIYEGNRSGEGYFSEDGRYLIFQSEREADNPFYQIYILDFETGDINRVSPGHGKTTCAYFQWNGDRVMYSSSHLDPDALKKQKEELDFRASGKKKRYSWDYETTMDIFSSNRDGSEIKQLTEAKGYDAEGSYSPDGKLIVYSTNKDVYNRKLTKEEKQKLEVDASYFCDLFIMNADGSDKRQLTNAPGYDGGPFFSPDGERIIFRRFSEDGHAADVYTINIDGTEEKRLTDFGCLSWAPYYHPSGDYIVWAANKEGYANFEIYMTDVEGLKEPIRVTFTDGFDGLPVFSPDGSKLVWTSSRTGDGKAQLFISSWNDEFAREELAKSPYRTNPSGSLNYNFSPEISTLELTEKLSYIASDEVEGRMTGSKGIKLANDYITNIFKDQGLVPLAGHADFNWEFDFISEVKVIDDKNAFQIGDKSYELNKDFNPLASTESGMAEGPIVFAGYGMKINDGKDYEYDSYASLDVKDKIVMVLDGIPYGLDEEKEKLFERNIASGYKQMIARQNGAKAILIIKPRISSGHSHEVVGTSGIISAALSENVANEILLVKNETVESLQEKLKDGEPKGLDHLFETDLTAKIETKVERVIAQDNNIVAMIPSDNPEANYIFIGAHYDHLGFGETNSRSMGEDKHKIHNGADDNGSGTVSVVELVEFYAGLKRENPEKITHNLVFCLWSAEELGLIGSNSFASKLPVPNEKVKAYINYDMVGRMQNNKLELQGLGSAEEWKSIMEKKNIVVGFDLTLGTDPYLPTDATSFYLKGIPVASFFSGIHMDYHTFKDDVELINFEDMQRVVKFSTLVINELLKPEQALTYKEVKVKANKGGKGAFSVTLGTIPAYAGSDDPGVQIQGVRPGGPAEKAQLLANDIIISLNNKEVNNIYDFMNILGELKPDVETDIVVKRNGEEKTLTIIPEEKK